MSRTIFVLLAICVFVGMAADMHRYPLCPENAEWTNCGTACPATCFNLDPYQPCTMQCIIGCQCKAGYVLDALGDCVLPSAC